ncbi:MULTISPECIES: dethiobiotin synthase [Proteus]|jgi:dethiobiotin synthetase|uniref:ATP-dependent dethiobiotin synthetase BioD n=1 Tax=Proteus vulgaris TaxID=585 RepID=A0A379F5Z8_PROVU|nr:MULTISPECIES: dethiobiotin synthase [Proteus]NBN61385.1 ATP-dependent dethiobiotin synthetase BioD [Proteus sp. G2639]RNT26759.1 ATP-dependent dethiobiotin synthetase BioD [Proteus mirabilis]AYY79933.1 ATP-dependent dethiobiotin synthetase BioD [Proteus vulgaris]KGA59863.1 dethiobiotin synthase [Proteus vulgaris]MBG5971083.1 ATP-dependent dethiobiotin synthetase BioD [Proteus vulgaris]
MAKIVFLTGTDTEVGKTVVSSALLQCATEQGYQTVGYKPVASGSEWLKEGLRNSDALTLQKFSTVKLDYHRVNPYCFEIPTSPHIVSGEMNQPIDFNVMSEGLSYLKQQADWVLVEGAGGWFTPLSENQFFSDWVISEQLPVILTVGIKLGCINHALLTQQAIIQSGLTFAGWIANEVEPAGRYQKEYLATLKKHIKAPFLGKIPYLNETKEHNFRPYLDLSCLKLG